MDTTLHLLQQYKNYCENNRFDRQPADLYEPIDYILSLGGKNTRPLLLLMGYELFGSKVEEALPAAYAVELFHNFSLVHDDIMDQAPLRRGKPTVHAKYGLNAGILSGDAMLVYVYWHLAKLPAAHLKEVMDVFNETAIGVCEGQQFDMNFEQFDTVPMDDYIRMIELKTSVLLGGALHIGAILGGASQEDALLLNEFGRLTGIAFQIKDDLLDSFGDPEKVGKKTGGDIAQNKKTYLFIKAMEAAPAHLKDELLALYHDNTDSNSKIDRVKAIFLECKVVEMAEASIQQLHEKAIQALDAVRAPEDKKMPLRALAQRLREREF